MRSDLDENPVTHEYITRVETWNSGGNIILDIVYLKDGTVLVIDGDQIGNYSSLDDFLNGTGTTSYTDRVSPQLEG